MTNNSTEFPLDANGLGAAVDQAIERHASHIRSVHDPELMKNRPGDSGLGDELMLYPDDDNPREYIRIRPVASTEEERNLVTGGNFHLKYQLGGMSVYAVFTDQGKRRAVEFTNPARPQNERETREPDFIAYQALINALRDGQPEKPTGRFAAMWQKLRQS